MLYPSQITILDLQIPDIETQWSTKSPFNAQALNISLPLCADEHEHDARAQDTRTGPVSF